MTEKYLSSFGLFFTACSALGRLLVPRKFAYCVRVRISKHCSNIFAFRSCFRTLAVILFQIFFLFFSFSSVVLNLDFESKCSCSLRHQLSSTMLPILLLLPVKEWSLSQRSTFCNDVCLKCGHGQCLVVFFKQQ